MSLVTYIFIRGQKKKGSKYYNWVKTKKKKKIEIPKEEKFTFSFLNYEIFLSVNFPAKNISAFIFSFNSIVCICCIGRFLLWRSVLHFHCIQSFGDLLHSTMKWLIGYSWNKDHLKRYPLLSLSHSPSYPLLNSSLPTFTSFFFFFFEMLSISLLIAVILYIL